MRKEWGGKEMREIVIKLTDEEANRKIEDEEENIMEAWKLIHREIENILTKYQIRYIDIE